VFTVRKLIVILLVGFAALSAVAAAEKAPEGLLYLANFDQYAAANWAKGTRALGGIAFPPRLVEGRFGKALLLPARRGIVIIGDDGNFNHSRGTVEMWIRPNWNGDDGQVHSLFRVHVEPRNYINLNKLSDNRLGVATGSAGVGEYRRIDKDVSDWKAGEWHHVAFTYGDGKLALFIDGKKIGETDGAIPPKRAVREISVGATLDGAIDELAIWEIVKERFNLSSPINAPDMGKPQPLQAGLPPLTKLDKFQFCLPTEPRGYTIVVKYFVDEVDPETAPPEQFAKPEISTFAARGEWQSVGFVIYATRNLKRLKISASPLQSPDGKTISAERVRIFLNRRVLQRKAPRTPPTEVVPVAALLDPFEPFDLPAGYFKEVTITLHVPADAVPATYRGEISVAPEGAPATAIPLQVRVLPFRLKPSPRKEFGMYYQMDLDPAVREALCAELQDLRDHGVTHLYSYLSIRFAKEGDGITTSYDEIDEGLSLLRRFGFRGVIVIRTGFQELARLLGHDDVGEGETGESLDGDEDFARYAEQAIRGLAPLKKKYPEFELVVTHMDEVLGRGRLPLYIRLTKPIRRVPEQRIYITLHTMPRPNVPEMTRQLDPYVDIRCYNGHALDLWIQAGHSFDELSEELRRSGDEGWMYYNPHRPFFTAKWARIVNGLYMWWSPLHVHCPYRYRTMRTYPLPFIWNMGFSVMSLKDFKTPIATRQWEGFRLGAQDAWYFCMLEDLVAKAGEMNTPEVQKAKTWLEHLRNMMPEADDIKDIESNYPILVKTSERLDGKGFEDIRLKTAENIIALRRLLKIED